MFGTLEQLSITNCFVKIRDLQVHTYTKIEWINEKEREKEKCLIESLSSNMETVRIKKSPLANCADNHGLRQESSTVHTAVNTHCQDQKNAGILTQLLQRTSSLCHMLNIPADTLYTQKPVRHHWEQLTNPDLRPHFLRLDVLHWEHDTTFGYCYLSHEHRTQTGAYT